ncbi:MAG: hypothetical protein AB8B91_25325 [Rubripirellula sp.]
MPKKQSLIIPSPAASVLSIGNRMRRWSNRIRRQPNTQPLGDYPSDVVDSQGCEFGYEMFYHLPYAYHLFKQGLLKRTVSCKATKCFYFFSPQHNEVYDKRDFVEHFDSIAQVPHERPDFQRWEPPPLAEHYRDRIDFGFEKPPLLVFNKYNFEWYHPPINFLSRPFLERLVDSLQNEFTIIYNRPTSHIVHDHMPVGELNEKEALRDRGVILAEELYAQFDHVSFNEFQLCLLAQSKMRIAAQGGATYLNALFPGRLMVYHRYGGEQIYGNYNDFPAMGVEDFSVFNNELEMLDQLTGQRLAA